MSTNLNAIIQTPKVWNMVWDSETQDQYEKLIKNSFEKEQVLYKKLGLNINTVENIETIFDNETSYNDFMNILYKHMTDMGNMSFVEIFTTQNFADNVLSERDVAPAGQTGVAKNDIKSQSVSAQLSPNEDLTDFTYLKKGDYKKLGKSNTLSTTEYLENVIKILANRILVLTPIQNVFSTTQQIQTLSGKLEKIKNINLKNGTNFYNAFVESLKEIVRFNITEKRNADKREGINTEDFNQKTYNELEQTIKIFENGGKSLRQYSPGSQTSKNSNKAKTKNTENIAIITMSGYRPENQIKDFENQVVNAINKLLGSEAIVWVGKLNSFYVDLSSIYREQIQTADSGIIVDENIIKDVVNQFSEKLIAVYKKTTNQLFNKKHPDVEIQLNNDFEKYWNNKGKQIAINMLQQENDARKNNDKEAFNELLKAYSSFDILKVTNDSQFKGEVGEFFTQVFFRGLFGEKSKTATLGKQSFGTGPAAVDVISAPDITQGLKQTMGIQVKNFPSVYSRGNIHIYAQSSLLKNQSRYLGSSDLETVKEHVITKANKIREDKIEADNIKADKTKETQSTNNIEENILKILVKHIPEYIRYDELGKKDDNSIIYESFNAITSNFYMLNFRLYPASYIFTKILKALSDEKNWTPTKQQDDLLQMFHFDNEQTDFDQAIASIKGPMFLSKWEEAIKKSIDKDKNLINDNQLFSDSLFKATYLNFSGLQIYFDRKKMQQGNNIVSLIMK